MIVFEQKGIVSTLTPGASSSSTPPFRNPVENNFQPKAILPWSWCNFCKEHHEETTSEIKNSARDKIFGKIPEATIIVLDFSELEDVMVINTRNKSYAPRANLILPVVLLATAHPQPLFLSRFLRVKGSLLLSSLPNKIS
jgi:hypothetical protein